MKNVVTQTGSNIGEQSSNVALASPAEFEVLCHPECELHACKYQQLQFNWSFDCENHGSQEGRVRWRDVALCLGALFLLGINAMVHLHNLYARCAGIPLHKRAARLILLLKYKPNERRVVSVLQSGCTPWPKTPSRRSCSVGGARLKRIYKIRTLEFFPRTSLRLITLDNSLRLRATKGNLSFCREFGNHYRADYLRQKRRFRVCRLP